MKRYYFLSKDEYYLLYLFDLTRFVTFISNDSYDSYRESFAISYSRIDELARVVYSRKIRSVFYRKLVSFVERLQDILEKNPDLC